MTIIKRLATALRYALAGGPSGHHVWRVGDYRAEAFEGYWGWRWAVWDEEGELLGADKSRSKVAALWAATRTMDQAARA